MPEDTHMIVVAGQLGEIKAELTGLRGMDERLRKVEQTVAEIKAQQRPRTPWYAVVGAVVGIVGGLGTIITLFVLLSRMMAILGTVEGL